MIFPWRKPARDVVDHSPVCREGEILEAIRDMGVGPLVWDWLTDPLFGLGETICSVQSQHQLGAVRSVDNKLWATIALTKKQRLDGPNPRVEIVCRSWERRDAHTFHRFDVRFLCYRGLCLTSGVTDRRHTVPHVTFAEEPGLKRLLYVKFESDVLGGHFFMYYEPTKVVDLPNEAPRITAEVLANEDWESWH